MSALLESRGFDVAPCGCLEAAEQVLHSWQPRCAIVDLLLSDGHAIPLIALLCQCTPPVRVAVLHGAVELSLVEKAASLRPVVPFSKPLNWAAVLRCVDERSNA